MFQQCSAVADGGVQGGQRDLVAPLVAAFGQPGAEHVTGSALDDVE